VSEEFDLFWQADFAESVKCELRAELVGTRWTPSLRKSQKSEIIRGLTSSFLVGRSLEETRCRRMKENTLQASGRRR
jgi:hypothetical protein